MKTIPTIAKFMTTCPHSVGVDQTAKTAIGLLKEYKIRHLPVLDAGKVRGLISDRDLKTASSLAGFDPAVVKVEDIAVEEVYEVAPDSKLDEVAADMAEKKLGSAVVLDNNKLVGIFTAVDGLRALSELLHTRLK